MQGESIVDEILSRLPVESYGVVEVVVDFALVPSAWIELSGDPPRAAKIHVRDVRGHGPDEGIKLAVELTARTLEAAASHLRAQLRWADRALGGEA